MLNARSSQTISIYLHRMKMNKWFSYGMQTALILNYSRIPWFALEWCECARISVLPFIPSLSVLSNLHDNNLMNFKKYLNCSDIFLLCCIYTILLSFCCYKQCDYNQLEGSKVFGGAVGDSYPSN